MNQYGRHIRRSTAIGALAGGVYGGDVGAANTAWRNVGKKNKDKQSVLKGTGFGALGGAVLGGGAGYGLGRLSVSQHKAHEKMRENFTRAQYERAHKASGGTGDWNYHTYRRGRSFAIVSRSNGSKPFLGSNVTKQCVLFIDLCSQYIYFKCNQFSPRCMDCGVSTYSGIDWQYCMGISCDSRCCFAYNCMDRQ